MMSSLCMLRICISDSRCSLSLSLSLSHRPHPHPHLRPRPSPIWTSSRCTRTFSTTTTPTPATPTPTTTTTTKTKTQSKSASASPPAAPAPAPRVRFAPSPTGYMHLGGLRTAIYNWLIARQHPEGQFILRIEDTDQKRYVPGAVEQIQRVLTWAGIEPDQSPSRPGDVGPYIQSQRLPFYKQYAEELLAKGHAYKCYCTEERLKSLRTIQDDQESSKHYDRRCLKLSLQDQKENDQAGLPFVIRMKIPDGATLVRDLVRGRFTFENTALDDQVLLKSDGYPTYHLASVVDDHLMRITHVIRGEEWLASTPKHIILYRMLGWKPPKFVHVSHLLNEDGTKLSKRHEAANVEYYMNKGFLPAALCNAIMTLGWQSRHRHTFMSISSVVGKLRVFTLNEIIDKFSLQELQINGAIVKTEYLEKYNVYHYRLLIEKSPQTVIDMFRERLRSAYPTVTPFPSDDQIIAILYVLRENVESIEQWIADCRPFLTKPDWNSEETQEFRSGAFWDEALAKRLLTSVFNTLSSLSTWTSSDIARILNEIIARENVKRIDLLAPCRYCLTGHGGGPPVYDIMYTLGREETLARLDLHRH